MSDVTRPDQRGNPALAAGILGFALGGFIDGILLHQVLQWHHLLSLVPGESMRDLRTQILWDGLFHVLMYALACLGLWMLWRARGSVTGRRHDIRLVGTTLLGFGIWQMVDVIGFHWIAGLHRVRVDVPEPLIWDIGWLVVFAGPSLAGGWWLLYRANGSDGPSGSALRQAPALLAWVLLVAGSVSLLPPRSVTTTLVVFRPGLGSAETFAAVAAAGGRILWASERGDVLAVDLSEERGAPLYANGALLVSSSPILAGCLAWTRV